MSTYAIRGGTEGARRLDLHVGVGPATFLSVIAVCVVTAGAGCLAPALRALRLHPVAAIRSD